MSARVRRITGFAGVNRIMARRERPHYIEAWAEHRGFERQIDLARHLGADGSVVNRWYSGSTPSKQWQAKLAEAFNCDAESLFRHPDDDWLSRFLSRRTQIERDKIKAILKAMYPEEAA